MTKEEMKALWKCSRAEENSIISPSSKRRRAISSGWPQWMRTVKGVLACCWSISVRTVPQVLALCTIRATHILSCVERGNTFKLQIVQDCNEHIGYFINGERMKQFPPPYPVYSFGVNCRVFLTWRIQKIVKVKMQGVRCGSVYWCFEMSHKSLTIYI